MEGNHSDTLIYIYIYIHIWLYKISIYKFGHFLHHNTIFSMIKTVLATIQVEFA